MVFISQRTPGLKARFEAAFVCHTRRICFKMARVTGIEIFQRMSVQESPRWLAYRSPLQSLANRVAVGFIGALGMGAKSGVRTQQSATSMHRTRKINTSSRLWSKLNNLPRQVYGRNLTTKGSFNALTCLFHLSLKGSRHGRQPILFHRRRCKDIKGAPTMPRISLELWPGAGLTSAPL